MDDDLPTRYGNWNSIYHKFRQWCRQGLFTDADSSLLEIDSTFCKAHQAACSASKTQAKAIELFDGVALDFDAELYKQRNLVERFFQRIKNYRHVAFRFDKLAECFLNFVLLASVVIHF